MNRRAVLDQLKKILSPPKDPAERKKLMRKLGIVAGVGVAVVVGVPVV
jgi:hypothetical protein